MTARKSEKTLSRRETQPKTALSSYFFQKPPSFRIFVNLVRKKKTCNIAHVFYLGTNHICDTCLTFWPGLVEPPHVFFLFAKHAANLSCPLCKFIAPSGIGDFCLPVFSLRLSQFKKFKSGSHLDRFDKLPAGVDVFISFYLNNFPFSLL